MKISFLHLLSGSVLVISDITNTLKYASHRKTVLGQYCLYWLKYGYILIDISLRTSLLNIKDFGNIATK